jgi:hypothetical protein
MTIASVLALNVLAISGLLALLAAAMRIPYKLEREARAASPGSRRGARGGRKAPLAHRRSRGRAAPEPAYSR